ncbi:iron-sulfur cluster assembly scaffold protein [uncultured Abyssibacter sp.]|uniref:iron-sulfur cluster assembly scaffold protein n=1 Tax=uncultured Abyssibacter sp. TaxID=2320202 RepID=UPI0032B12A17
MDGLRARFETLGKARQAGETGATARAEATTPAGDDVVEISLWLNGSTIERARFRAHGSPATLCAADWVCEFAEGRSVTAAALSPATVVEALDLPRIRMPAALMAVDALVAACRQADEGHPQDVSANHQSPQTVSTA